MVLVNKHGVPNSTLYRMRKGKSITMETLNYLCSVLDCDVQDVIVYIKSDSKKEKISKRMKEQKELEKLKKAFSELPEDVRKKLLDEKEK